LPVYQAPVRDPCQGLRRFLRQRFLYGLMDRCG